jgi:hypothetical protein
MLAGTAIGVFEPRMENQRHAELQRYLRLEYGGRMTVDALLADLADGRTKVGRHGWSRLVGGIRAFAAALSASGSRGQAEAPTGEV